MSLSAPSSASSVVYTPTPTASAGSSSSSDGIGISFSDSNSLFGQEDIYRPSFFELIASDRLMIGLKPALAHCMRVVSQHHPSLRFLVSYSDEVFYLLSYFLERHYLSEYGGSFSENFYGLKRMRVRTIADEHDEKQSSPSSSTSSSSTTVAITNLSLGDQQKSLLVLVLVPYLKSRLDWLYQHYTSDLTDDGDPNPDYIASAENDARNDLIIKMKRIFVRLYPTTHACYEGCLFLYQLRYLFDFSSFSSPWSHLFGLIIRRLSYDDLIHIAKMEKERQTRRPDETNWRDEGIPATPHVSFLLLLRRFVGRVGSAFADSAKWLLIISIFSFRFVEWWYSPSNRIMQAKKLPPPPPPQPAPPTASGRELLAGLEDKTHCAICKRTRVNPACLPSGYVFCYACVHNYVSEHGFCPITHRPCQIEQIRRIYEN